MEKPLDWIAEANSVIESEKLLVNHISISSLEVSNGVYLNIRTLENLSFCVLLNNCGFRVVAEAFDQDTNISQTFYETQFALLSNISKCYCQRFHELVAAKLTKFVGSCEDKDNSVTQL